MIFNVKSEAERLIERTQWKRWFAWFPVFVSETKIAWLQVIEWRYTDEYNFAIEYRLLKSNANQKDKSDGC